jgi:excisionase family DNA binding protein
MTTNDILTVEEVARYLKMQPQTVYKWAQEGRIPGTKLGKEWRFRKSIIDEWIDMSIALSKSGFDLMYSSSWLSIQRQGLSTEEIEGLIKAVSK